MCHWRRAMEVVYITLIYDISFRFRIAMEKMRSVTDAVKMMCFFFLPRLVCNFTCSHCNQQNWVNLSKIYIYCFMRFMSWKSTTNETSSVAAVVIIIKRNNQKTIWANFHSLHELIRKFNVISWGYYSHFTFRRHIHTHFICNGSDG